MMRPVLLSFIASASKSKGGVTTAQICKQTNNDSNKTFHSCWQPQTDFFNQELQICIWPVLASIVGQ